MSVEEEMMVKPRLKNPQTKDYQGWASVLWQTDVCCRCRKSNQTNLSMALFVSQKNNIKHFLLFTILEAGRNGLQDITFKKKRTWFDDEWNMSMERKKEEQERMTVSTCCPLLLGVGKRPMILWCHTDLFSQTIRPHLKGVSLPCQQGELLCPGGMCPMTHRLLSPTLDAQWFTHTCTHKQPHAAAVHRSYVVQTHTHTYTQTHCASVGTQCSACTKNGLQGGCGGGMMEMLPGDRYPNTALTLVTPVAGWINGSIDTHGQSETTELRHKDKGG